MVKSLCYVCEKMGTHYYTLKDYWHSPQTPEGMTKEDFVCYDCYHKVKEGVIKYKKEHMEEINQLEKEEKRSDKEEELEQEKSIDEVRKKYKKNRFYEYKDEYCAILQRIAGAEVQFIKAFSDLTREGYRLMAQDEGGSINAGFVSAGVNAYFYFQKIKYVTPKNVP